MCAKIAVPSSHVRHLNYFFVPRSVAVICTPAATVPRIVSVLGAHGRTCCGYSARIAWACWCPAQA
jgi:hypothetical protein